MDSSPGKNNMQPSLPSKAGLKRPAPPLLPAFEPFTSSSPGFPRPSKRQALFSPFCEDGEYQKYPTPVPTSTTGILSSSPPRVHARPGLKRTQSIVSERAPLSQVTTITLSENGEELRMGRSSVASHYQLSTHKLISRVHVTARYIAATENESSRVEIKCTGWNGVKVHCHSRTWELAKGDSFTSATESAEIMLDAQDARVIIAWPARDIGSPDSARDNFAAAWDDENSPPSRDSNARRASLNSSPLRIGARLAAQLMSPESPTPASVPARLNLGSLFSSQEDAPPVKIFEDESSTPDSESSAADLGVSMASTVAPEKDESIGLGIDLGNSQESSDLSEPENDADEENDPIIHSFGPFGANISSRMASITAAGSVSPEQPRARPSAKRSDSESTNEADMTPVVNHVVNQLAYSRLSSTPLSVILNNLPASLRGISSPADEQDENPGLSKNELHKLLTATKCIGEIGRSGKDAAGKPLESEFYYIPSADHDEARRVAVEGLRKPSLRECRKQHKQYYWKKPKTP